MRRLWFVGLCSTVFALYGCLPADTRSEPARVVASARLPEAFQGASVSFDTSDGYTITLNELMVSLGDLELTGGNCTAYSVADYLRILDLRQPGPQKIAQVWGLDDCRLSYAVRAPDEDAVLGVGVTEEERALMADGWLPVSWPSGVARVQGMAVHVAGTIVKGSNEYSFDWGFSSRLDFQECRRLNNDVLEDVLPLVSGETLSVSLVVDPTQIFEIRGTSLVQPMIDADQLNGNANGRIAVNELVETRVEDQNSSLGELLRTKCYPAMFQFDRGGSCTLGGDTPSEPF